MFLPVSVLLYCYLFLPICEGALETMQKCMKKQGILGEALRYDKMAAVNMLLQEADGLSKVSTLKTSNVISENIPCTVHS